MNTLIESNFDKIQEIFKDHFIKEAYLFGSSTNDSFTEYSDIDMLISFQEIPFDGYAENFWDLEDQLESVIGRKVDLVPEHTLKNPYFIKEVNRQKVKIYG